ncbi:uncharacterized protein LOC131330907 isoform X3 [Rhododendron vialii]|uniref:uncharacterized protein LOC131330341 isoform X3 n=1 Tax=Rhododendron vialii TaxID=182163 RepID=UPI00265E9B42|nr:uncharacterized protein LOC131330341 isoform X3 [Rhododendron vialii]XP_058220645.1 uncharacterized protein LOC131330907 isoform X3 [Rhododendron vialii]
MDNITIFGQADKHLQRTVELLQKNNVRVVIRDEQELNAIRIREEKRRAQAIAAEKLQANRMGKGKQKATCADKRKDNALVELRQHRNGGVVIRDELELHNRQEERNAKAKVVEKRKANSIGKGKQKSTCSNNGKENVSVDLLHHRNGVVIHDELEIRIRQALNDNFISRATLAQRARRDRENRLQQCTAIPLGQCLRVDPPQKRQCLQSLQQNALHAKSTDWEEKAMERKRINSTRLRHWLSNSIVVHALNWYIEVDTQTFWRVMEMKFKPLNSRGV